MQHYDVFNGDADGILSLLQLRQIKPKQAVLITGVKRDINLLKQVPIDDQDKTVTVLDISMEKNAEALKGLLEKNHNVFYADHHRAGDIPQSEHLEAYIDLDANICTALIVDQLVEGKRHLWAITAAYGDNLIQVADKLAQDAKLTRDEASALCELGTLVNYNGYGETLEDLHFSPADLYNSLVQYASPFDCILDESSVYHQLKQYYSEDHNKAKSANELVNTNNLLAIELEDAAWARRISGVYGNELANANPDKAILVLTKNDGGSYRVSLRAPINNKQGAGDICASFATGGGRAAAAGINVLPENELSTLIDTVEQYYQ